VLRNDVLVVGAETRSVLREDPFAFPYRLVLQHPHGTVATLDPEFLPLPIDRNPGITLTLGEIAGFWQVERIEDEADFAFRESEFAADPTRRMGTVYPRQADSG